MEMEGTPRDLEALPDLTGGQIHVRGAAAELGAPPWPMKSLGIW